MTDWIHGRHAGRCSPVIVLASMVLMMVAFGGVRAQSEPTGTVPAASPPMTETTTDGPLSEARAREIRDAARAEFEAIGADVAEDSVEGLRRAVLQRRMALAEEYLSLVAQEASWLEQADSTDAQLVALKAELQDLADRPAPQAPETIDRASFEALEKALEEQRKRTAGLRAAIDELRKRVEDGLPRLIEESRTRVQEAEKRAAVFESQLARAADEAERRLTELNIANARLDREVAGAAMAAQEAELAFGREAEPLRLAELEVAEKRLAALEARFAAQGKVLEAQLAVERARAETELARKEEAAEAAATPADRLIAEWEARLARSEQGTRTVEAFLVALKKDVAEQEKRLAAENEEQAALRDLIRRSGTTGTAGERIALTLQQLGMRRGLIERSLRTGLAETMNAYRERRFEIEDTLLGLGERLEEARQRVLEALPQARHADYVAATDALFARIRSALRDEKAMLTEAIGLGQRLRAIYVERLETLDELERFLRSRAFWLRDAKPLGPATLQGLTRELGELLEWVGTLRSEEMRARLAAQLYSVRTAISALILFPVLPVLLFLGRQRLRRVTRAINDRALREGKNLRFLLATLATGLLSAALIPAYLLLASRLVAAAGLPPAIGPVLSRILEHTALFLFLWFLSRSFFHRRGIAEVQYGLPREAANAFHGAMRWLLLAYGVWLLAWSVFNQPPFEFRALTRIAYTLFELTVVVGIVTLLRPRSAFVRHRLQALGENLITRNWPSIALILSLLVALTVALDVGGYRYAARSILLSFVWSLATLLVLPTIYGAVVSAMRAMPRRRAHGVSELTGEEAPPLSELQLRVERFLRILLIVIGVVLIAGFWGLDQQALATLDEIHIYAVQGAAGEAEFLTAADIVRAALFLVFTFWVLRALPGIYEFALFPRLKVDEGVKYATLTISRYSVFVLGVFLALAEVHLDLGRLGWLMAAIGVGLGFGLQEIVSNFVSGIILLVERPVRPGDVVTVGSMTGTVQRINIRATTILNFDRQEVMVPNRSLITSEVTNWTRGDAVNRVVIPIGVAYGTDVDRVTELLKRIAREQPEVLTDPPPSAVFMNHGESSLDFNLRVFVPSPDEIMVVRHRLNTAINKAFAAEGIEIPFPQRDLHLRSSDIEFRTAPG